MIVWMVDNKNDITMFFFCHSRMILQNFNELTFRTIKINISLSMKEGSLRNPTRKELNLVEKLEILLIRLVKSLLVSDAQKTACSIFSSDKNLLSYRLICDCRRHHMRIGSQEALPIHHK